MTLRTLLRYYKKAITEMGIRYLSPHCCRHTYASRLHAAGIDPKTIQTLMGHTDYALTANVYTHVQESKLREAVHQLHPQEEKAVTTTEKSKAKTESKYRF